MGFDAWFLGIEAAMPAVPETDPAASVALDYLHFTVVLDTGRRFARITGVNVDGARLVEVPRGDAWRFDERIPEAWQAGPAVYARNDLDRRRVGLRTSMSGHRSTVVERRGARDSHVP